MKKVFASDFDGTLFFSKAPEEEQLPEASVKKILEFQAAGGLFGLCTGRQIGGLTPFIGGHFDPDFYITASGGSVVDGKLRTIQKREVDKDIADQLIRLVAARHNPDYRMTFDVEGDICVFKKMDYPGRYHIISGVEDMPPGMIHQVSIHTESEEEAQGFVDEINATYGHKVQAFRNVIDVDVAPKGCSKGRGAKLVKDYFGDCVMYGIGDSMNDLPLLEAADVAYTFPYAPKELQEKAAKVVDTIAEALEDAMAD